MPGVVFSTSVVAPPPVGALQDNGGGISAMYIVGFSIAGTAFLAMTVWLAIRFHRKRFAGRRQDLLGAAFLSMHGLVKEEQTHSEKCPSLQTPLPTAFLRNNLTSQVVFPIRAHLKTSPEQLGAECDYTTHLLPDNTPKSFSLTPHASASPSAPTPGSECSAVVRNSYAGSRLSSFSIFSTASSLSESIISATSGRGSGRSVRKVRQAFNPVLPDELLISLGEKLIILQSFDDGWCVVGRENGFLMSQSKSLLIHKGVGTASGGANTDLGMVPAWCFLKPVKGLRAERPVRSSSLSVMVQTDRSGMDRNDTISWSNF
ncbi:hypothetical protein Ac2012v2_002478 [Leucoagaricus gongylophorus]